MAETIYPYALTTLARVKVRLDMDPAVSQGNFDTLLIRMINGATDWIERECGARRFLQTLYTNEIYSATGPSQKKLTFRQGPVAFITVSGVITQGSATVTGVSQTAGLVVGMKILSDQFPIATTIASIPSSTSVTMSAAASSSASPGYFQANGLFKLQWRSGTPSNPTYTDFILDQYELINDGKAGLTRIYGVFPRLYNNMIRATYLAGYLINWANAGDGVTHTLPADLSDVCENLVIRRFKRRQFAGKTSEALEGASTSWSKEIDEDDKAVIGHYFRMPSIF